jgi:6-phosphogluconate dehydrogenase
MNEQVPEDSKMHIGVIGLGRMGGNIVRRMLHNGHRCVGFNDKAEHVQKLAGKGAMGGTDLKDLAQGHRRLEKPRAV